MAKATGHVSNYSEDKVRPYTLPDPLVTASGQVSSAQQWFKTRRPEILKFYREEIYGGVPDGAPRVTWEVAETDAAAREGTAIMKRAAGRLGDKPNGPRMNMTLYLPAKASGPVPILLNLTFGFGPRGSAAGKVPARGKAQPAKAGTAKGASGFDPIGEVLKRGWGYATLNYSEIQPDRPDRWTEGVIGLTLKLGQTRPAPDEWGTISAWAWGASRAIDQLQTDPAIDARRIAIMGMSRLGKTVLWAAAQDERVATVFAVVPGELGASLIRRDWGETLDDMAQNFPLPIRRQSPEVGGPMGRAARRSAHTHRPVRARAVFITGGLTDQWSDPVGEFLAMVAAGPVYRLLGGKDLGVTELPPLDRPVTGGDLGFHYHSSGHTALPADWRAFLEFAERHFRARKLQ